VKLHFAGDQAEVWLSDRFWRVSGLAKNTSLERLEVHLHCVRGEAFHRDRVEIYSARARSGFLRQASMELGVKEEVLRADLGKLLLALEEIHERQVRALLQPKTKEVKLSEKEREEALSLLRDRRLQERIVEDLGHFVVGERTNKLAGYLVAVSRLLARPLGLLVQSASAAGKSALIDAVSALMPQEACVRYSAMTAQSLFYMGDKDLKHKLLIVAEEKGVEKASYPLKLLLSDGRLSIASTGKDPQSGKQVAHEYQTQGPTGLLCSSTAAETDEELQNRCLVTSVDESREQTRAIHALQRRRAGEEGLWAEERRAELERLHHNAQRLLRPLHVLNPWAEQLTFLDEKTRTRRDHLKYLTLIEASALLHQYQREVRTSVFGGALSAFGSRLVVGLGVLVGATGQ
jgi:hypothetical protein